MATYQPVGDVSETEGQVLEARPRSTWGIKHAVIFAVPAVALFGGLALATRSGITPQVGSLRRSSLMIKEERFEAKACFASRKKREPLDMNGQGRLDYDNVDDCQRKCRRTTGCEYISWWEDGGCHLADGSSKEVDGDSGVMSGPATCEENLCFNHGEKWTPLDSIPGRGKTSKSSPQECHNHCKSIDDCVAFSWWPDGGCHIQGASSSPQVWRSSVISGPRDCPLVPTDPTPTPVPTPGPVTPVTPAPTPAPIPEGCETGRAIRFNSHRLGTLTILDDGTPWMGMHHSPKEEFILTNAGDENGHPLYHIQAHNGKFLAVKDGKFVLSDDEGASESFLLSDAGQGRTFVKGSGHIFMQDFHGHLGLAHHADNYEKWYVHDTEGKPACHYPSTKLLCFTVMHDEGHDLALLKMQYKKKAGVFSCDITQVFSDGNVDLSDGAGSFLTTVLPNDKLKVGRGAHQNHDLFIDIWQKLKDTDRYHDADWVVKVNPASLFMADRLKERLGGRSHSHSTATFFANCAGSPDVQLQDRPVYMHGPMEVFSKLAVDKYFEGQATCESSIKFEEGGWWEERFMTHCLEMVGVKINPWLNGDLFLLSDPHCIPLDQGKPDCHSHAVTFHPLDTPEDWEECYDIAHHGEDVDENIGAPKPLGLKLTGPTHV